MVNFGVFAMTVAGSGKKCGLAGLTKIVQPKHTDIRHTYIHPRYVTGGRAEFMGDGGTLPPIFVEKVELAKTRLSVH